MQVQQQKQEVSQIQSLNLVQNLLLASIGSISYVRNLFHESNYTSKKVQGLPIRTLQRGHTHQADLLLDWLELGCFDALRKQFLKTVHLYIKKGDSLLESYSFSFKYPDGKAEMEFSELSSTKTGLARTCV